MILIITYEQLNDRARNKHLKDLALFDIFPSIPPGIVEAFHLVAVMDDKGWNILQSNIFEPQLIYDTSEMMEVIEWTMNFKG